MAQAKMTARQPDHIDAAIEVLNRAMKADHGAITALMELSVPCNETLAGDKTVKVWAPGETGDDASTFGLRPLGLINGLFGVASDGCGYIAANYRVVCEDHGPDPTLGCRPGDSCSSTIGCKKTLRLGPLTGFVRIRR